MKHVVCKSKFKGENGIKYVAGDYANISDELYERYAESVFQLIEDLPEDIPEKIVEPTEEV